jgi:hypothetical protein
MDEDEMQVPPVSGRGAEFGSGMLSGGEVSPGLAQMAARYKAQTPTSYQSTGSPSGISADQYKATMGGLFPIQNGASTDTYDIKKFYPGSLS